MRLCKQDRLLHERDRKAPPNHRAGGRKTGRLFMTRLTRIFLVVALLAGNTVVSAGGRAPEDVVMDKHLVVIAIDGLRDDIFERYVFKGEGNPPSNSFFGGLAGQNGEYRKHLRVKQTTAVFPSYTFPAWASVFTGVYPGKTGIQGQHYYMRDLGKAKNYEETPGLAEFYLCDVPDSIRIYGWEFNCGELHGLLATLVIVTFVTPGVTSITNLILAGGSWYELFAKLPEPCVTVWVPSPLVIPVPVDFCLINLYASGGVQNGDLEARTVYDYAREADLSYYVVHNMYNRSNLNQSGAHVAWQTVYDGSLKNMDFYWGRPTYREIRHTYVLPDPDNLEVMDAGVIPKAKDYVTKNGMPEIMTLYFAAVDGESHNFTHFGHASLEETQFDALRRIDLKLIDFVSFLKARPDDYAKTVFLLIADHGHSERMIHTSSLALPEEKYRVEKNGYMAHVYIRNEQTKNWNDPPTQQDYDQFLNTILPDPQNISLQNDIELILGRSPSVGSYRAYHWNGSSWDIVPLENLENSPYLYVRPESRIEGINDINRSGDVILLPKAGVDLGSSITSVQSSTHGSLRQEDSLVPFYVWGPPITMAKDFAKIKGPWILCGASHVDITPTILNLFDIYEGKEGNFDGKPLLSKDLKINFTDFAPCRGSGASDFLLGRWKDFEGERSQIWLHNPTSVDRDVVLLYYGWRENFLGCQIARLSPHDLGLFEPPIAGGGPVEIRAAPVQKEARPGGLVGYVRYAADRQTVGLTQLMLEDQELFNIKPGTQADVARCACDQLQLRQSPLQKVFCSSPP